MFEVYEDSSIILNDGAFLCEIDITTSESAAKGTATKIAKALNACNLMVTSFESIDFDAEIDAADFKDRSCATTEAVIMARDVLKGWL